jgi:hypothetical protein
VHARHAIFNFDTDWQWFLAAGNHYNSWSPTGGNPATGGYLSICDGGANGETLVWPCPVLDGTNAVKAFHFTADLRVGNSSGCGGQPDGGFSLNYCREGDPVPINFTNTVSAGTLITNGAAGGDDCATTMNPAGSGEFENGCKTGVSVIFNASSGNLLPDTGPGGTCGPAIEGVTVRVDDHTLTQIDMSAHLNGGCNAYTGADPSSCNAAACADCLSEQTGACWNDGGGYTNLCWQPLEVELNTNQQLTVIWKGCTLVDHLQLTNFTPLHGQLVIMGRTGACSQNVHLDNFNVVTMPILALPPYAVLNTNLWSAPGSGNTPGFRIKNFQSPNTNLFNGWDNMVEVANAALNGIYGADISDKSVLTQGGYVWNPTVINYAQRWNGTVSWDGDFPGDVAFPGIPGPGVAVEDNCAIEVNSFIEFPAAGAYALAVNSDGAFRITEGDRTAPGKSMFGVLGPREISGEYVAINTSSDVHGFGALLPPSEIIAQAVVTDPLDASTPLTNAAAIAGRIAVTQAGSVSFAAQALNCFQAGAIAVVGTLAPGDYGQLPSFRAGSATVPIPCLTLSYADGTNIMAHGTANASSPLILRVSADDCSLRLGRFEGGRYPDTVFSVYAPKAGLYPLRLVWEHGGGYGDASCEWFTFDAFGYPILINDPSSSVKAWIQRTVPSPAILNPPGLSGEGVTVSWVGTGELEYAYDLSGPWYKSTVQDNPQTVPPQPLVPARFYRVRSY